MPIGKASVYDLISNEHLKYANEKLHLLMSLLWTIQWYINVCILPDAFTDLY